MRYYPSRWRSSLRWVVGFVLCGAMVSASRQGLWSSGVLWPVLFSLLCAVFAWAWWQQTSWPKPYPLKVRFQRQRWWFMHQNAWRLAPARSAFHLLGMVGIPHPERRGHVWIFRDECSADEWRRLMICVRFSRSGSTDELSDP
ncbi:protein YgfX [Salinispirillum marinum]|uniref:Protein YgfX n=2 Tax=Saccharospirillaceae TaxID=255527 RepID=A0ABV8BJR2_9GAMM